MQKITTYTYLNQEYEVIITKKRMKNIRFRLVDGRFLISAPYLATTSYIIKCLDRYAPLLIKKQKPAASGGDYIYLFGYRCPLYSSGTVTLIDGTKIDFTSFDDLEKKMRKPFLSIITERVRLYERKMGLNYHNVRVRNMNTRYGSNSKQTNTVSFALKLYHYPLDVIDSIVVHELAHSIHFDHSKAFYQVVYKYCPNYDALHKKLDKGEYAHD